MPPSETVLGSSSIISNVSLLMFILNLTIVDAPFNSHKGCRIASLAVLCSSFLHSRTQNSKSQRFMPSIIDCKSAVLCNYYQAIIGNIFRMAYMERKTANRNVSTFGHFNCKYFDFAIQVSKFSKYGTQTCKICQNCNNYCEFQCNVTLIGFVVSISVKQMITPI